MRSSSLLLLLVFAVSSACSARDPSPSPRAPASAGKHDKPGGVASGCRFAELHRGEALVGWETELIGPVVADDLVDQEAEQLVAAVALSTGGAPASLDDALAAVDAGEVMLARLRYETADGDPERRYAAFQFLLDDVMQFVYFRASEVEAAAQVVDQTFALCNEPL